MNVNMFLKFYYFMQVKEFKVSQQAKDGQLLA
jgi:hypothetical protein